MPEADRRLTLLPGRAGNPASVFLVQSTLSGFFQAMAFALYGLYVVRDAQLSPAELIIVGTALEASAFLCEVPTGVIAGLVSRRLSVILGMLIMGLSMVVMGLLPSFIGVMVAQVLLGLGFTCISGAREAWIADEAGEEVAGRLYPRGAQLGLTAGALGIVSAVGLGLWTHAAPLVFGGIGFVVTALYLAMAMTEANWRPSSRSGQGLRGVGSTVGSSLGVIRRTPIVRLGFAVAFLLGFSSEAFDRLWSYRLLEEIQVPGGIDEVVLFGMIALLTQVGGVMAIQVAGRWTGDGSRGAMGRVLSASYLLIGLGVLVVALAGSFWLAVVLVLAVGWIRTVEAPFFVGWVNRGLDPGTRATVLSGVSQGNALGQVASGPVFAGTAGVWGVRAALALGAVVVLPAAALVHTAGRGESPVPAVDSIASRAAEQS